MPDIDTLSIGIKAHSDQADEVIDRLIDSLGNLDDKLNSLSVAGFATQIDSISRSLSQLNNVTNGLDSEAVKGLASGLRSLANASKKITDAQSLTTVATGLRELSTIAVPDFTGFTELGTAMSRLASTDTATASNNLITLVPALQTLSGVFIPEGLGTNIAALGAGLNKLGGKKVVDAAAAIPKVAESLMAFSTLNINDGTVESIRSIAEAIKAFGYKKVTDAIVNIPKVADAFADLVTRLNQLPAVNGNILKTATVMADLATSAKSVGTMTKTSAKSLDLFSTAVSNTSKKSFSLASALGKVYANFWIFRRAFNTFKGAGELASSLTEVNNVVLQAFGTQNTAKVDAWSKTLIKGFGLSELAAKEAASRYQAMGVAIGISQNEMADMSMTLTELAADIGSLYNKDFADVAKDMNAVFTGMVAPLRKYGIDLTQANLKQYALSQGMDGNIKSMTQMQKTMLRYQYVLNRTSIAQGDFTRTSGRLCAA